MEIYLKYTIHSYKRHFQWSFHTAAGNHITVNFPLETESVLLALSTYRNISSGNPYNSNTIGQITSKTMIVGSSNNDKNWFIICI